MRILQIHNAYRQRGGEDTIADAEAELLASAGHDVQRHLVENPDGAAAATARLAASPWNAVAARRLRKTVDEFRPDVAHVHNTWYSLTSSAPAALRAAGIPTVMTLHNYRYACLNGQLLREGAVCELCLGRLPLPGIRYRCYRNSLPSSVMAGLGALVAQRTWADNVDRFLVMTSFAKSRFLAAGLPPDRFVVKPHHAADPGQRRTPAAESRTVLFVGRLAAEKGIRVIVEAWRGAAPSGLALTVVGDGPLRSELERAAPPSVRFTGWLPAAEVRRSMLEARVLLFPSIWYETFGLVMVEAMAAGLPVIASDLGGIPEVIGPGGALVPPGNVTAWAERLRSIAGNDVEVAAASGRARLRYEQRFTQMRALADLEQIYGSLIAG